MPPAQFVHASHLVVWDALVTKYEHRLMAMRLQVHRHDGFQAARVLGHPRVLDSFWPINDNESSIVGELKFLAVEGSIGEMHPIEEALSLRLNNGAFHTMP